MRLQCQPANLRLINQLSKRSWDSSRSRRRRASGVAHIARPRHSLTSRRARRIR